MGGGAGFPSSVRVVLFDVGAIEVLGNVGGGTVGTEVMEDTRLWDSKSMVVSSGISFGHSVTNLAVELALDVWSLMDRDGVQSIVDVSFEICRDRLFELSCFCLSFCETMLIFPDLWLLLVLYNISLNSNSEFAITIVDSFSRSFSLLLS